MQALALLLSPTWLDGLFIDSPAAAIGVVVTYALAQALFWWLFVNVFSPLPVWLYPLLTFGLSGAMVVFVGSLIPGIEITRISTGVWIVMILTSVSTVLSSLFSLDLWAKFDRHAIHALITRRAAQAKTDVPGFLYLEIDGLGEELFRRALRDGRMPTLQRWVETGTHTIRALASCWSVPENAGT